MTSTSNVIADYFRCPESLVRYLSRGDVHGAGPGFFRFGEAIIAYGKLTTGNPASCLTDTLEDVQKDVSAAGTRCVFPFEPSEIIENLRRERYTESNGYGIKQNWKSKLVRDAYYLVRPILPVAARKHLQRKSLRDWRQIPFPHWPVDTTVDQFHAELLKSCMKQAGVQEIPFIWFWPEGLSACAIMTHDVEAPAGYRFCDTLMDLNDSFGIKSSFQVVPEKRYEVQGSWLRRIADRGFEVNVHDLNHDGHLFDERQEFLRRAEKINQYGKQFDAQGFRAGVLYRNQDWLNALDFVYDMSVPNVAHLDPQRGGCCTVLPYLVGNLLELPVTCAQDYSLFNILQDYSTALWESQIERILTHNGMASFIIHPDYVIEKKARNTYAQLLAILAQLQKGRKIWLPLPRDVARWWKHRSQMHLGRRGDAWVVEGPSCERARLAFARLENSRLTFRLANA